MRTRGTFFPPVDKPLGRIPKKTDVLLQEPFQIGTGRIILLTLP
jgi:hypothetical protein